MIIPFQTFVAHFSVSELNFNMEDSFIQEYIDDPYLIDGRSVICSAPPVFHT